MRVGRQEISLLIHVRVYDYAAIDHLGELAALDMVVDVVQRDVARCRLRGMRICGSDPLALLGVPHPTGLERCFYLCAGAEGAGELALKDRNRSHRLARKVIDVITADLFDLADNVLLAILGSGLCDAVELCVYVSLDALSCLIRLLENLRFLAKQNANDGVNAGVAVVDPEPRIGLRCNYGLPANRQMLGVEAAVLDLARKAGADVNRPLDLLFGTCKFRHALRLLERSGVLLGTLALAALGDVTLRPLDEAVGLGAVALVRNNIKLLAAYAALASCYCFCHDYLLLFCAVCYQNAGFKNSAFPLVLLAALFDAAEAEHALQHGLLYRS